MTTYMKVPSPSVSTAWQAHSPCSGVECRPKLNAPLPAEPLAQRLLPDALLKCKALRLDPVAGWAL